MGKLLFITNLARKIGAFSMAGISAAAENGLDFYMASNWSEAKPGQIEQDQEKYGIVIRDVGIERSPTSKANIAAYKNIVNLIREEQIDCIHCHTPAGGLLGRLAGKKCGVKKVIYQVHGFHFYKGAPLLNWLIYYPVEWLLAHWTDAVVTINYEDYAFAQKKLKLRKGGKVYYVPGVGIDTKQFAPDEQVRQAKRQELGLSDSEVMLISAGELNENKNNKVIISALAKLQDKSIHYFLCGVGDKENDLRRQAEEAGLSANVHFLGFRQDMKALLQAADVFVMPSFREGLSRSIMEAMSAGLPCVVSKIRGNVDLVTEGKGGYLHAPTDVDTIAAAIDKLATDPAARQEIRAYNLEKVKQYDIAVVTQKIREIYTEVLKKD